MPTAAGRSTAAASATSRRSKKIRQPVGLPAPAGKVAPLSLALDGHDAAPVIGVGVTKGHLDVPEAVQTLGWWVGGAGMEAPAGSIVVTGHVDSRSQGIGYLAALRNVAAGQRVTITASNGAAQTYVVTGRRAYRKAQGLPGSVFDQTVQRRLVLITCTGAFDEKAGRYEDNLVVYAVPVDAVPVDAVPVDAVPPSSATPASIPSSIATSIPAYQDVVP